MTLTRREMLAACAAAVPVLGGMAAEPEQRTGMGLVMHSYPLRTVASRERGVKPAFSDPLVFLDHCRQLGAGGIQVAIGTRDREYTAKLRAAAAKAEMYVEG